MIIEIRGTQFLNKGAELMLLSILEKVKGRYPGVIFCQFPFGDNVPLDKLKKLGIKRRCRYSFRTMDLSRYLEYIPRSIIKMTGEITENDVDVVLDASGFAYGDQWGYNMIKLTASQVKRLKKKNIPFVFLPQAFGPFTDKYIRLKMAQIIESATLCIARDEESENILRSINPSAKNIAVYPDFTNLFQPSQTSDEFNVSRSILFVTNQRMIDKTTTLVANNYIKFLVEALKLVISHNTYEPCFLIHEVDCDINLVRECENRVGRSFRVIQDESPIAIKQIIMNSAGMVGSRFHGIVSALSEGIPTIATSWSHKYRMLLKDYDIEHLVIDLEGDIIRELEKMDYILNDKKRYEVINAISKRSVVIKEKSSKMWEKVFEVIDLKCSTNHGRP